MKEKLIALALLGFAGLLSLPADEMVNGDFSDGISRWEGNAISGSSNGGTGEAGAMIKLRDRDWQIVSQEIELPVGDFTLRITAVFSSDLKFSGDYADYVNLPPRLGINEEDPMDGKTNCWSALVTKIGRGKGFWTVAPAGDSAATEFDFQFSNRKPGRKHEVLLAFPPGTGTVLVKQVSITP